MSGSRTWMGKPELLYFIVDGKAVACEYRNEARKLIQNGFFRKYGYGNVIVVNPTFEKFNLNSPRAAQYFAIKNLDKR